MATHLERTGDEYQRWIKSNEPSEAELEEQRNSSKRFAYRPRISIITPVWNPPPLSLWESINSVVGQTYDNWELCLVNACSDEQIRSIIEQFALKETRIKVHNSPRNYGISENSNLALQMVTGEFVALLDHDDTIAPFALYELVKALNGNQTIDFIYSDNDWIINGKRCNPLFNPDWSPELLISATYNTHLSVIRKRLVDEVGGFRPESDGAQDWDLFLRVCSRTNKIHHIPKVLYHWAAVGTSVAGMGIAVKDYAETAQLKAVGDHLKRKGIPGIPYLDELAEHFLRIKWILTRTPLVSVVIVNRGKATILAQCVDSLLSSTYKNVQLVVVDAGQDDSESIGLYNRLISQHEVRVVRSKAESKLSSSNDLGALTSTGEILLFMKESLEPKPANWLEELLGWVLQKEIGIVGAKIVDPSDRILHAGIIIGLKGLTGHVFRGRIKYSSIDDIIFGSSEWYRNYSAVSGDCLMIRREVYDELGGIDSRLGFGWDIDLCLRAKKAGYRIVYTPVAVLRDHRQTQDSEAEQGPDDVFELYRRLKPVLKVGDPYYNPNLSYKHEWPTIATAAENPLMLTREYLERIFPERKADLV
jgi:glycosyltransferase involved in cell wall biosynthesis